jgi:hypothetical protein
VVARFRAELAARVEGLSTSQMARSPSGYTIKDGRAVADDFVPMKDLPLE